MVAIYSLSLNIKMFIGTTITEKWSTDNQLNSKIELNNQLAKGVKV